MTKENVELGFLGFETKFRKLTQDELEVYLQNVQTKKPARTVAAQVDGGYVLGLALQPQLILLFRMTMQLAQIRAMKPLTP